MKLLYHYTIELDPRTKKNHQQIVGSGAKCPFCHKPARQFVRQGKAHDKYCLLAAGFLTKKPPEPISTPVSCTYHFYMQTRRRVDELNLCACTDDLLVACNILADDNSAIIKHHDGTRVLYDKERPRTEIFIYEYNEKEDNELERTLSQCDEIHRAE